MLRPESRCVSKTQNVLFLCTGNSAHSILAEAILNRDGAGRFRAYSAGSQPKGVVHPAAIRLLDDLGFSTDNYRSKSWDEFAGANAPPLDFIFTVCGNAASEVCPVWPGHPATAHWGVDDPATVEGDEHPQAFRDAFHALRHRIGLFLNLPFESLDPASLQTRLREIGQS
jgi:protein-tyrosine-phosphatase